MYSSQSLHLSRALREISTFPESSHLRIITIIKEISRSEYRKEAIREIRACKQLGESAKKWIKDLEENKG